MFQAGMSNSRHFTVHTLLSHVALLVSFPFQFNAVEVQQKREKKATSLTLAKDAIVDMRLNEKTSNKTRRTRNQSKKDGGFKSLPLQKTKVRYET